MKCALCGRVTLKPAVLEAGRAIGPVCARRAVLVAAKPRRDRRPRVRGDGKSMEL